MLNEDLKKVTDSIQEKIGKEKASLIADNIATILSNNMQMNNIIADKDKKIDTLNKDKEGLMQTNMNLLQQIPMGKEEDNKPKPKEETKKISANAFNYNDCFDEDGNFKL